MCGSIATAKCACWISASPKRFRCRAVSRANEFGSVPYASPERLDTGDVNFGSDLWSLAVMLYEMVAGTQPYAASDDRPTGAKDPFARARASAARYVSGAAATHHRKGDVARSGDAVRRFGGRVRGGDRGVPRGSSPRASHGPGTHPPHDQSRTNGRDDTRRTTQPIAPRHPKRAAAGVARRRTSPTLVYTVRTVAG